MSDENTLAEAWDAGFAFGYWLDRGYGIEDALSRGLPDHLRSAVGLEPRWDDEDDEQPVWNPYRRE